MITAAADGSALGNPGPSGWAWYIDDENWAAGGWAQGTNNKGELEAVAQLLQATRNATEEDGSAESIHILCDSQYVINSMTKWIHGWKKKGWKKADGKPVLNVEQIKAIDELIAERRARGGKVTFEWVRGHSGHVLNEAADSKANSAAQAYRDGVEPLSGPGFVSGTGAVTANDGGVGDAAKSESEIVANPVAVSKGEREKSANSVSARKANKRGGSNELSSAMGSEDAPTLFDCDEWGASETSATHSTPTTNDHSATPTTSTTPPATPRETAATPTTPTEAGGTSGAELPTMKPMAHNKSNDLFSRAKDVIPGGVNSPVRAFGSVGGTPLFIDSAKGARITDVDGNDYVDLVCSWGPMLHGNAHPQIVDAVRTAATKGLSFGAPTEAETLLAQEIISRTSAEEVRMVNSGTEATMSAVRLARGFTGRTAVLKFAGCYHGHVDSLLVSAGSGVATFGLPDSPGVSKSDTIVVEYNNLDAVRQAFAEHPDEIACIITEAAAGNMGTVAPAPGFNAALKEIAHEHGALLIMDEVMTGFRTSRQGWFGVDGVAGDLVTFGKVVSGGLPAAAFGGRREIMNYLAPVGPVYQAGTLSGNPVAMAAGLASLQLADDDCYATINANADRLASLLHEALDREGVAHHIQRAATFLSVRFAEGEGTNFGDMQAADTFRYPAFFHALLDNGVYAAPSVYETWFVSTALTDEDFSRIESALRPAAKAAARATK